MKVYHVKYDHQWDGSDYGLFSSLEKAEKFLKEHRKVDISKVQVYDTVRTYPGNYRIEEKSVG